MVPLIVILSILIVGIAVFLICWFVQKKYETFVLKNSVSLKRLKEINGRYIFYPYVNFNQSHTYDNANFFETVSCSDYLIYQLQFIGKKVSDQIEKINTNKKRYTQYIGETEKISTLGEFQTPIGKLKQRRLLTIEDKLFKSQTRKPPSMQFSITITLYCAKMSGQIYSKKHKEFMADDVLTFIKRVSNKRGDYFCDREIWNAICRVERAKVSNRMRFSIYERDGHRCCKCGISDRYADLEVDHIVPIAKGGKSTYDNLQTLCHKCNVEKGAKLPY